MDYGIRQCEISLRFAPPGSRRNSAICSKRELKYQRGQSPRQVLLFNSVEFQISISLISKYLVFQRKPWTLVSHQLHVPYSSHAPKVETEPGLASPLSAGGANYQSHPTPNTAHAASSFTRTETISPTLRLNPSLTLSHNTQPIHVDL